MWVEFKHTLGRLRGQIVGWAAGVGLYGLLMAFFYPSMIKMDIMIEDYVAMFPQAMLAFFESIDIISTPMGYLDVYFFSYLHLIIGILAVGAGAGLLAGDEEKGVLDLVLSYPVSRSGLFLGRVLGLIVALIAVLAVGWLSWALPAGQVGLDLTPLELLLPFIPLLAVLLLFSSLALLLSMVMPAARLAAMFAGALLVANYLVHGLSKLNEKLVTIIKYTPLYYYQGGTAVEGIEASWLAGLFLGSLLLLAGAGFLFQRRDIRVGGERSWGLPSIYKKRRGR